MPFNILLVTARLSFCDASQNEVRMKKLISLSALIITLMLMGTSSIAFAGKIYKWVDSEGKVHYGERPPAGQGEQMRVPRSSPGIAAPAPKPSSSTDTTSKFLEDIAKERKEKQEAADKSAKEKELKDKNCSKARRQVASLKQGGRRFEVDEKGERHYLDDADIQTRLKEAEAMIKKWCN